MGPGGAPSGVPFIPDPSGITNTTAASVPGLDAAAAQVAAANSTLNLNASFPIPAAGFAAATSGPANFAAGGSGVVWGYGVGESIGTESVPAAPVLPEHVAGHPGFGAFVQETQVQLLMGPNNETIVRQAALPGGGRKLKSAAELAQAIPNYPSYLQAHAKVCQALHLQGCSVAGMAQFQETMLNLAGMICHSDSAEWALFLELDRTLRLKQHAYRRRWDYERGCISQPDCSQFTAQIAGRHAALEAAAAAAPRGQGPGKGLGKLPPYRRDSRQQGGGRRPSQAAHIAQPKGTDCKQWWYNGTCTFGNKCKYAHTCALCSSSAHGTAQCPTGRPAE